MEIVAFLQSAASPLLDQIALAVTNLGSEYAYIALLVVAYLGFDQVRGRRLGINFLVSVYVNALLKELFATPRPFTMDPDVLRSVAAGETAPGNGFPSGHAQSAATFWGIAAIYIRTTWFSVLAVLLIVAISLTRLYLGVHLPIDIVGGLALGGVAVLLVPYVDRIRVPLPGIWQVLLALLVPLLLTLLIPVEHGEIYLGGLAGFLLAPFLSACRLPARAGGRVLLCVIGLLLAGVQLVVTSLVLPEGVKELPLIGYLRYLAIAFSGLLGACWLLALLGA